MNLLFKLYCRTFQFCLKVAFPILPYRDPIVLNRSEDIIKVISEKKKSKPLLVSDKTLTDLHLVDIVTKALEDNNIPYAFFNEVEPNPTTSSVEKALKIYKEEKCDFLIALGGGSVIDLTKAVGARVRRKRKSLNKMKGILKVNFPIPLLIAIPTTAGTGSETTLAAVIVDSESRHKYAINDFPLIPKYAVLDYRYIENLPKPIIASTGMDALTHALEAYIGRGGNKKTRKDALEASKLIFENLEKAYNGDLEAKKNMLQASFLAGRAFSKAYVGNVHALAHALGGKYNTPHGLANAVILPYVLKEYGKVIDKKLANVASYCNFECEDPTSFIITKIETMNKNMGIGEHLFVDNKDLKELAAHAYKEANPLYPNPKILSKEEMIELYRKIGELND